LKEIIMGVALPTSVSEKPNLDVSGPFPFAGETPAEWEARKVSILAGMETAPTPPAGGVFLGRWRVATIATQGSFYLFGLVLTISDFAQDGFDKSAELAALAVDDVVTLESATGSNELTVDTVVDEGGYFTVTASADNAVGVLVDNQIVNVFVTAA
jgi:hypothetical protein